MEPSPHATEAVRNEESEEEEEPRWQRSSKKKKVAKTDVDVPHYGKMFIRLTSQLALEMVKFSNQQKTKECEGQIKFGKKVSSGKRVHEQSLKHLGAEMEFVQYITAIGFKWLLDLRMPKVSVAAAQEFFTSFKFQTTTDLTERSIRLFNREMTMSLNEWSIRLGLYTAEQEAHGDWFDREIGNPKYSPRF